MMIDVPAPPPDTLDCAVCGAPAVIAYRTPDEPDEAVCGRHRSALSRHRPGRQRLELRWGRWCSGQERIADVVLSGRRLPCEACCDPGDVLWSIENDGGRWEAVLCLACLEPGLPSPGGSRPAASAIRSRGHARWDGHQWEPVGADWGPGAWPGWPS
ncbi:MAG: hypothetical protein ACKVZ6_14515 [Kineosporiaceae bacterium]